MDVFWLLASIFYEPLPELVVEQVLVLLLSASPLYSCFLSQRRKSPAVQPVQHLL
jgi:hypothetical protein